MAITPYMENGKKLFEIYINGFDSRGRRIQRRKRGVDTQRKAEVTEFEMKRELAKLKDQAVSYRWNEWFEEAIRQMRLTLHPETVDNYSLQLTKWVKPRWGSLDIDEITSAQVRQLIFEELGTKLSPNSKRAILKMVRRVFQMALESGVLDRNPCLGVQVKVPEPDAKVLTNAQADLFLREARMTNHRFFPVWLLALKTGMRTGELMALSWRDIDFETAMISVSRQWTSKAGFAATKSQKSRVVPISEDLLQYLREFKLRRGAENEFVLPRLQEWQNGEQARITREFCTAIGVTPVKFHDLRATFITNLLARGVPLAQVMAVVGHSQLKTTNVYLRKAGVEVRGVTDHLGYKTPPEANLAQIYSLGKTQ
ncbi:MAG: site-specific integrase [Cryobacterium sp.]|nr:site-specific integrase [Oligoflexia bacterium]